MAGHTPCMLLHCSRKRLCSTVLHGFSFQGCAAFAFALVQIIAICFGIVYGPCSKLFSTASTAAAASPHLPPTSATMLVQLPRILHVFTVSDRPRCLSRSASGSIVWRTNKLFSTASTAVRTQCWFRLFCGSASGSIGRLCNRLFSTAPQLGPFSKHLSQQALVQNHVRLFLA